MPSQPTPAFLAYVATNVRTRRSALGLSQKALADASDVSLRMIGAIESGSTSVSTATLDRIGVALDATLADLVSDPSQPPAAQIDRLGWVGDRGGQGVLVSSIPARREIETWDWRLEPGDRYDAGADPVGWRVMLIVVEGQLTLELEGEKREILPGAHLFESTRSHAFANASDRPVRFFRHTIC